jgi:hypothetical protein
MNKEDIIRMAREANVYCTTRQPTLDAMLERFATLVAAAGAAAENEACDMGAACIGCSPRNADGSCPDAGPSGTCDCYKDGFRDGMNEFKECYEEQPAQKDAARYLHIKGMARAMSLDMGGNHYWHMGLRDIRGPNLDEAIDRAIKAEGQA